MKNSQTNGDESGGFLRWIRQPPSWLSVIALTLSLLTAYQVSLKPGQLQIIMPDKVGVALSKYGYAQLLLPVTFTNTGATQNIKHVTHISATMRRIDPHLIPDNEVAFHWRFELKTKSRSGCACCEATEERKSEKSMSLLNDAVEVESRTFPFAVDGGKSIGKLLDMPQEKWAFQAHLNSFELVVYARTSSGVFSSQPVRYVCTDESRDLKPDFGYCDQE